MTIAEGQRIDWLDQVTRSMETRVELDGLANVVGAAARPFNERPAADFLRGTWLGHAFHPLLTDLPLGFWMASILLDMTPGKHRASQALVGAGLAAVPLTAAAGMSEWDTITRPEERRVTAVHAVGNTVAALAFFRSWTSRRRGRQVTGKMWSLVGGSLALATGYLGGHLSFSRLVGTGRRGRPSLTPSA